MRLDLAGHFRHPPAGAYEEEAWVFEEFRGFAFDGVADELERPADDEERDRRGPEAMPEDGREEQRQRQDDERNSESVAEPVQRMLMALCVFADPTVPASSG